MRLLIGGQSLSMFGDSVMLLVLAIWVKELTGSNAAAGLVILVILLPSLGAPFAGYVVDRVRRRRFLVLVNLGSALAVLPLLFVDGRGQLAIIYAVAFAYGVSFVLIAPTTSSLVHAMVPADELAGANGILQTVREGLRLVGPLIGAGLYQAFGGGAVAVIDAFTFVAAAGCVARIGGADRALPAGPNRLRSEVTAGMRHVWHTRILRRVVGVAGVAVLVVGFGETVFFAVVDEGLHRPPAFLGVISSIQGAGALLGGFTAARLIRGRGEPAVLGLGLVSIGLGCALCASSWLAIVAAGTVLFGLGVPWAVVAMYTVMQVNTPENLQGRVSSAMSMVVSGPQTLSIGLGALAVAVIDYRLLLATMTIVLVGCGVYLVLDVGGVSADHRARTAPNPPAPTDVAAIGDRPPIR